MKFRATWNAARQAWSISASAYKTVGLLRRLKQNVRWVLATAAQPDAALRWFSFMETQNLRPFSDSNPLLVFKPMRAYLSTWWSLKQRTKVMRDTYGFILWKGGAIREALLRQEGEGVILATFPLGDLGPGVICLGFDNRFRKEGEFTVSLQCPQRGGRVSALTFALEWSANGLVLYVGCVQGRNEGDDDLMKALGKAMHGLRPKALVVFAAQEIGRAIGVREFLGAGNSIQVHRSKHFIYLEWAHALNFDYDVFWTELGGQRSPEGWFYLPRKVKRRTRDEMKPNKRGMYAKRYAMMDDIASQIRAALPRGAPLV